MPPRLPRPIPPPPIPPPPGYPTPPPLPALPDWRSATVIDFAQGDLVFNLSISSLDHCDGSFLFQNSDSPAYSRNQDCAPAPEASSSSPRRVSPHVCAIRVVS